MTAKMALRGFSSGRRRFMLLLSVLFGSLLAGPGGGMGKGLPAGPKEREAMFYRRLGGKGK
jgi:hypothetical protein